MLLSYQGSLSHPQNMEQQASFSTTQENNTDIIIDNIAAGLSLAVLVAVGTLGNIVLLVSVASAMRIILHQWQRLVHELVFVYGCLEALFFFIPCLLSTYAYLTSWRVDSYQSVCDFFGWVVFTVKLGSVWIMTLLAIERYLSICRQSGQCNKFAWNMRFVAFVGIVIVTIFAAVPLIGETGMVTATAVPSSVCHFDFTPRTITSQAFALTTIVLVYIMFQISLFCHVSILCHSSRDMRKEKTLIQEGALEPDKDHPRIHTLDYAFTPLTLWMWACIIPLWVTVIMAQTGFEVGPGLEFGVLRTITVCSTLSPYILLASTGYYRTSFCNFICCRNALSSNGLAHELTIDIPSVARCADCHARITRIQEHGQRAGTVMASVESRDTLNLRSANQMEQDINRTSHHQDTNRRYDWPKADTGNDAHQIPRVHYDDLPSTSPQGVLPSDSRVYLLSAGENGELVCRGSFDGGSFANDHESSSPRSDQGSISSRGSYTEDRHPEEEYCQSPTDQADGYLITLPVNMPGQGSNETVERIFYIQEPLQRGLGSFGGNDDESLQVNGAEDTTSREEDETSHLTSSGSSKVHNLSRPNLAGLVAQEGDSESDEELEDEELSRVEAEIRGRIMGRSYLGKMRRSSAPQPLAAREGMPVDRRVRMSLDYTSSDVKTWNFDDQDSPSLSQQGLREQDIRIHGPSASDPHLVTLAFQQAMLAHSQQNKTEGYKENDAENGQSNEMIRKTSLGQLIPVINITPAQNLDELDEVQPIFTERGRRLDYRFLAPIAEEASFVSDRSSPRTHNQSSVLNTKHEKVHRMPKTTFQIMSNRKLQDDVRRSASTPPLVIQNDIQNTRESIHEDHTTVTRENEQRRCPSSFEDESVDSSCDLVTRNDTATGMTGEEESSSNISPRTLERVGNVIESKVEGKEGAADPLLETPEWINVEHVMQGKINQGFVASEDIEDTSLCSKATSSTEASSPTTVRHDIVGDDSVREDEGMNPAERGRTELGSVLNTQSEEATDSSACLSTSANGDENEKRQTALLEEGCDDTRSFKKVLSLKRQERVSDGLNEFSAPSVSGQPADDVKIHWTQTKCTGQEDHDNITMSTCSILNSENDALKAEKIENVAKAHTNKSIEVEKEKRAYFTENMENEEGANKTRATDKMLTAKGKRLSKSVLSSVNSYPLTRMRAFSIDGNLYVMYPNKRNIASTTMKTIKYGEGSRSENEQIPRNDASLKKDLPVDESVTLERSASYPFHESVQFTNIVKKREQTQYVRSDMV